MKRVVLCACLFCLYPVLVHAEKSVYVIDQITITLRAGQGTQHQILRTLPSGTPMEVLRVNEDSGYSQVRTKDGVEGWVLSQYLIDEPTSPLRCEVKVRYRSAPAAATVTPLADGRLLAELDEPQFGVAPGQALVCYDGDRVLGGGWIE